ncbi:MAG: DUF3500 domain-containing protein [Gemmatimonadota bacterium]|nr:DUF3500 domain-containing protein [Gemmatimonadota bacterium]MDH3421364.1 DUF3500 domain-containing protein [Gemmatimonadota bacterium]
MKRSTIGGILVALVLVVVGGLGWTSDARRDVPLMVNSANQFLASLTAEQRARATFAFDNDEERLYTHFIPPETFERRGVTIKEMSAAQKAAARNLLRSGLSQRGYMTVGEIMEAEGLLEMLEGPDRQFARDGEAYYVTVFGSPSNSGSWGWRWEGHHLSLHYTIVNGNVTVSAPTFLSASPSEVPSGPRRGMRPLKAQEDAGRALLGSLTPAQRRVAIFAEEAPTNILAGPVRGQTNLAPKVEPLSPAGIAATALEPVQRELLMDIVDAYASVMSPDIAALRMAKIEQGGTENITFAWAGGTLRGEVSYFRVQGPSFLIEFDHTQRDPNHVHSAWRDFEGDFGRDLIGEHMQQQDH